MSQLNGMTQKMNDSETNGTGLNVMVVGVLPLLMLLIGMVAYIIGGNTAIVLYGLVLVMGFALVGYFMYKMTHSKSDNPQLDDFVTVQKSLPENYYVEGNDGWKWQTSQMQPTATQTQNVNMPPSSTQQWTNTNGVYPIVYPTTPANVRPNPATTLVLNK